MRNVITKLYEHAKTRPHLAAINEITYEELKSKIGKIAHGLQKLGIEKNDRVIIFLPFSLELYLAMFSVQAIGAIAVFLDSWARRDQLAISARIVEPKAMISFDKAFALCSDIDVGIRIDQDNLKALSQETRESPLTDVDLDSTALITFTTGSSGTPKGANRTHRFLLSQHEALDKVIPYKIGDVDLPVFPIFALNNLASGITTILPSIDLAAPTEDDGKAIIESLIAKKVSSCTLSPSIFLKVANHALSHQISLQNLNRVVTGGAPISFDDVKKFQEIAPSAEIWLLYGSTEVEPIAHIRGDQMLSYPLQKEGVLVGTISEDLDYKFIKITPENIVLGPLGWGEWEVPKGEIGEIIVSGAHVCESYYNDPAAFFKAKIRDPDGKVWHRTGDVGILDERSSLWLLGRVHNTILRNGKALFPVQAEILLKRLPFVRQAAFLGIEGQTYAVVSLSTAHPNPEDEIKAVLEKHLIPVDQVKIVDAIPMDPRHHSKVEYSELRKQII